MHNPAISVVIPYYRAHATIARTVRSILAQTSQPLEILIIDDGSPEDPTPTLAEFANAVTLIRKPNGGASSARNAGIDLARGDWIAFLDADDYWEPAKLQIQLSILQQHPEVGLIGSRWFTQTPGCPRELETHCDPKLLDHVLHPFGPDAFHLAMYLWTSSLLIRKTDIGTERFISGLEPAEDRDFWVRIVAKTPAFLISHPLATYVMEPGGISRTNIDRDCGNMLRVVHRHAKLLGHAGRRLQESIVYRRWASVHLATGNYARALPPALKRLRLDHATLQPWWIVLKITIKMLKGHVTGRLRWRDNTAKSTSP